MANQFRDSAVLYVWPVLFTALIVYNRYDQFDLVAQRKFLGDDLCYTDLAQHLKLHVAALSSVLTSYAALAWLLKKFTMLSPTKIALSSVVCSVLISGQIVSKYVCPT
ncbi:hypothetical protein [Rhizobium sp. GCM10022189]|uniref:hypothetical protein n=1 Tax=Rhizobium sp. GCM10022189 TaxID=3252654 RepID=UPI0036209E14